MFSRYSLFPMLLVYGLSVFFTGASSSLEAAESQHQIEIPLKAWVARSVPNKGVPCPGAGCKHMRLAYNPDNGRIYFLGGDYTGPIGMQSGRMEVYSYSIAEDNWKLEFPYCGPAGSVQPSHPDEVGWAYDTKRRIFWMMPGYMGNPQRVCPDSTLIRGRVMTFDPVTRKWDLPERERLPGTNTFAQYDPAADSIIMFTNRGVGVYNIQSNTWNVKRLGLGELDIYGHYSAMNLDKRVIYVISPRRNKLLKYDMDRQTASFISDSPPYKQGASQDSMPIWDSVNKVLLWPQFSRGKNTFHVYHPDKNVWEENLPMHQPEGLMVVGRHSVFDPQQNALLLMGAPVHHSPHLFLYRYGNGARTARSLSEK